MTIRFTGKTIVRVAHDKDNPFMVVDRALPQNKELSYEAVGLLMYLLSKPDDWEVVIEDLQREGCGRDKVYRILRELRKAGHLHEVKGRKVNGRFTKSLYVVTEEPHTENPYTDKPDTVSPDTEKPTQHNKESTKQRKQQQRAAAPLEIEPIAPVVDTRPKIYTYYEQTTGNVLTKYQAEAITEACKKYGEDTVQDAMTEAARHNGRSWQYVEKILQRWEREGRFGKKQVNVDKVTPISRAFAPPEDAVPIDHGVNAFVRTPRKQEAEDGAA
jgi:DnaD/phage-associated family protein